MTPQLLTIHDRFYPVTLNAAGVDVEHIRVIDANTDPDWRPTARTNEFGSVHYCSGWFRAANGQKIRMYRADGHRLVLLPPKDAGSAVLLDTREPDSFVQELRRQWSSRS